MGNVEAAITQLHELKALGISISIDDFGTGYSSLSYLKRFPVDILKIDRSFVKDIPADSNDMEITAAIIAMAQKLKLDVVAEGVETIEQVEFLQNNNCYIVQGFYYSKPIAESELPVLYKKLNDAPNIASSK
jgi:EAL domain-containing protein (putative c-di-GMP-specific phosphodiesterase class I)